ncbi:hypothetical protein JW826_00255 [Candidatus Woesearchaeota archaeon]|nr:hypothetical protein [Candidatus Woesearchaeota archaeon]
MGEKRPERQILLLALMIAVGVPFASAAGVVMTKQNNSWIPAEVDAEFAAINFLGGVENIALAITTGPIDNGFWLIPIPSGDVRASPWRGFPSLEGEELKPASEKSLANVYERILAAQIYPLPYLSAVTEEYSLRSLVSKDNASKQVSEAVEAVSTKGEVVPASRLIGYLEGRSVFLNWSDLDDYVAQNFTFIVSWLPATDSFLTRGMFISFATDKLYYPVRISRNSGHDHPAVIYVVGEVTAQYGTLSGHTKISKLYNPKYTPASKDFFFGNMSKTELDYTRIYFLQGRPAPDLDLWFIQMPEHTSAFLRSVVKHPILWGLLVYMIISCLSSMIAAAIVYRKDNPQLFWFLIFGLSNMLTLIGFWTRAYFKDVYDTYTDRRSTSIDQWVNLTTGKRVALSIPVILLVITLLLIPVAIMLELQSVVFPIVASNIFIFFFIPTLVFTILIMWGSFHQKKILYFNLVFSAVFLVLLLLSFMAFTFFF